MRALYVGIDLGTTNSAVAAFDGEQVVQVRNGQGAPLTPSVVRIDGRGNVVVGARARRYLESDPANTRAEFKRLMGTAHTVAFAAAKVEKKPEELAAEVLRALRADVEAQLGVAPARAVISVPALFELPQTAATSEAARLAGFERVELIQEPVASAIAAGWSAEDEDPRPWLVYDLGGGTFDVSLLEMQEGMLRVVGHDGDNFLGGRDFDAAVVRWALERLGEDGIAVDEADPAHAQGLRKLRHAAEEAKIELARADEAWLSVPGAFEVDGAPVDVELTLDRATLEALTAPLVARSLDVCRRLLRAHGVPQGELARVVLVGGPTMMPAVRAAVQAGLGAGLATGLDPMTLVAQGAALFAASSGLDARPEPAEAAALGAAAAAGGVTVPVWLQYPSMTSDLTPFVVGRLTSPGGAVAVRLRRDDGTELGPEKLDPSGAFALLLALRPRVVNSFTIEGVTAEGRAVALAPGAFQIVHGVTLSDPPLARSLGVALADDTVRVFLERGCPLPVRRTFTVKSVEHVVAGGLGHALRVPVVQGELAEAHLNRLVGALEIAAADLQRDLVVGGEVELTLEMDRGGRLGVEARLPDGQVFREVAQLVAPQLPVDAMKDLYDQLTVRLARARETAGPAALAGVAEAERCLQEARPTLRAASGGDADAAEKARRCLLDADGAVAQVESAATWPRLEAEVHEELGRALGWVGRYGTPTERRVLEETITRLQRAVAARQAPEVKRLRQLVEQYADSAWARSPGAWRHAFTYWASRASEATDGREAARLVERGRAELARGDDAALEQTTHALYRLMPPSAQDRSLAFGSGVR